MMFFLYIIYCISFVACSANPVRYELTTKQGNLVYYVEKPDEEKTYPFLIAIEGSYVNEVGPLTVLRLHEKLSSAILAWGVGLITLERRGADGKQINTDLFHFYNTPSQRLTDHLYLVHHLRKNNPPGWNGKIIILGGSEGGPIAIKLSRHVNPSVCIALVGCGDQNFKEYIWNVIQQMRPLCYTWVWPLVCWWCSIPNNRSKYDILCEMMKKNPDHKKWWFGQTFRYWADALDQCEVNDFLSLACPCLVVSGSKDVGCSSTDRIVERAKQLDKDVTYACIEYMDHDVLNPQWGTLKIVQQFLEDNLLITAR